MVSHPKHKIHREKKRPKHHLDKNPWDMGKSIGIINPDTWKELNGLL